MLFAMLPATLFEQKSSASLLALPSRPFGAKLTQACGVALLLLVCVQDATAQYQWKDDNGRMVYSDRPPPSNISPKSIVKAPAPPKVVEKVDAKADAKGGLKTGKAEDSDPVAAAAARLAAQKAGPVGAKPSIPGQSLADKDLESKKKTLEAEQAAKKLASDSERENRNKAACDDNKASLRTLESGMRVATTNAKGDREFLADEERSRRMVQLRKDVAEFCK